jgi:hypothetical protein
MVYGARVTPSFFWKTSCTSMRVSTPKPWAESRAVTLSMVAVWVSGTETLKAYRVMNVRMSRTAQSARGRKFPGADSRSSGSRRDSGPDYPSSRSSGLKISSAFNEMLSPSITATPRASTLR